MMKHGISNSKKKRLGILWVSGSISLMVLVNIPMMWDVTSQSAHGYHLKPHVLKVGKDDHAWPSSLVRLLYLDASSKLCHDSILWQDPGHVPERFSRIIMRNWYKHLRVQTAKILDSKLVLWTLDPECIFDENCWISLLRSRACWHRWQQAAQCRLPATISLKPQKRR